MTRLFSVLYYPPAVFVVLSLALLGIGLGAAVVSWRGSLRTGRAVPLYFALTALATLAVLLSAGVSALAAIPGLTAGLVIFPFVFGGMALAALFSQRAAASPRLYWADLSGAGIGALAAIPLFQQLGVPGGLLVTIMGFCLAGMAIRPGLRYNRTTWLLAGSLLVAGALFVGTLRWDWIPVDMARLPADKPIGERLQAGGHIVQTRWDGFARTDLVDPGGGEPYELYMDGAAGSVMPPAAGHDALWRDIGFFPFATEQPARAFVIGPGGGLDVWFGLQSNVAQLLAAEVNGASVAMVHEHAEYNGDLYGQPVVSVLVDEGRSVLQRHTETYDLIFLSQVLTLAAERDGYSLVENTTYTVEAFDAYLDHLTPGGQIALKLYDEPTLTRALATAVASLNRRGLSDAAAMSHIIALVDGRADPAIPLLMIRSQPYTRGDALSIGAVARQVGFTPLFLPDVWAQPPLDAVAAGERTLAAVLAEGDQNLNPTTDNRPFFFQFERGIPRHLRTLLWVLTSIVVVGGALLIVARRSQPPAVPSLRFPVYFAGLGAGFMLVEIVLIQQTRLFLGHPTYAITVVLATLLVGGGLGSGLLSTGSGGRFLLRKHGIPMGALAGILLLLALWALVWPWLGKIAFGLPLWVRLFVVVGSLLPLALLMGMPFPAGLRAVGRYGEPAVAVAWAVNGVMSVTGAALALTLAIWAGYSWVLVAAGFAYALSLAVAALAPIADKRTKNESINNQIV